MTWAFALLIIACLMAAPFVLFIVFMLFLAFVDAVYVRLTGEEMTRPEVVLS